MGSRTQRKWIPALPERRLSLVYDADGVYKTPDEEIAARIRKTLRKIGDYEDHPVLIFGTLMRGMRQCMRRHVVSSCIMCGKFSACKIHQLDIDISVNGVEAALRRRRSAAGKRRKK
jgi:hypothetical protein